MPVQHAEFYLKISQTARIQPDDIAITFSRVVKDDRCGNCTVSGPLFVEVVVTEKGQPVGTFTLDDRYWIGTGNVVIKGYTLSIFDASPEPCGGCKEVTLDDYSVGFTLAKTASPNPATVRDTRKTVLSQQFYLKLHQAARSQPDNLEFTLLRVIKDERCPTSTGKNSVLSCTWSPPDGAVRVEVAVSQSGQSLGTFQLASGIGYLQADTLLFGDYELMLVAINPMKQIANGSTTVTDIRPDDYVVTMYLTKFAAQNAASGTPTPAR